MYVGGSGKWPLSLHSSGICLDGLRNSTKHLKSCTCLSQGAFLTEQIVRRNKNYITIRLDTLICIRYCCIKIRNVLNIIIFNILCILCISYSCFNLRRTYSIFTKVLEQLGLVSLYYSEMLQESFIK
jgi:hypothetical protein